MEFRLTYEGQLLSANKGPRTEHKHSIRRVFHPQLRRFWGIHPGLKAMAECDQAGNVPPVYKTNLDTIADRFVRSNGFRFVPMVRSSLELLCSLDILFLRPEQPGKIVHEGDIDNRLKTLFDALKVPRDGKEVDGLAPSADEDPFFCLLEDDGLITHVAVTTDFLLQPTGKSPDVVNDARLVITVKLRPYNLRTAPHMVDTNSYFA